MSRSRSPQRPLACYENWLRARGVSWDQRLQLQTPEMGSISGWGLRSSERIPKGEKLIQVPPAAALTARASIMEGQSVLDLLKEGQLEEFTSFDETSDCQLPLAVALILADKSWWPKLRKEVTPRHCDLAWNWSSPMAETLLSGTDLEKVVAAKQRRISEEFKKLKSAMKKSFATITLEQYTSACAVIMSRIQPWWGGSLVPFVDQANHDQKPHMEFRLRQGKVEARSIRVIEPGEVFQSYGELSAADSLFRYGFTEFASKASDIVVSYADVVTLSLKDLAEGDENFSHRAAELKALNLLEESPWDGLEDVGIELSRSRRPKNAAGGIKGLRRFWAACAIVKLSEDAWQAALVSANRKDALTALGAPPSPGVDWEPALPVLKLCLEVLELRSQRLGSLKEEEVLYDEAVEKKVEAIHLGLQQLRVVEAKLLQEVVSYVQRLVRPHAG